MPNKIPNKKTLTSRRERITQAADTLFDHYGHEKTTMQDIARESGIPRATIYLEFPGGKEDIVMASAERYMANSIAAMRKIAEESKVSKLDTLLEIFMHIVLTAYERLNARDYKIEMMDGLRRRVYKELDEYYKARREFYQELLEQAAQNGEISPKTDFARVAELLQFAMKGTFLQHQLYILTREQLEKNVRDFFKLMFDGIPKP